MIQKGRNTSPKSRTRRRRSSGYVLGRAREWNLGNKLRGLGYIVFRMPQSKGGLPTSKIKPVDLIAMSDKGAKPILIQVSKNFRDITKDEIDELVKISEKAGADPLLAYVTKSEGNRSRWQFREAKTMDIVEIA